MVQPANSARGRAGKVHCEKWVRSAEKWCILAPVRSTDCHVVRASRVSLSVARTIGHSVIDPSVNTARSRSTPSSASPSQRVIDMQTATAARSNGNVYASHFDGAALNSLGHAKLDVGDGKEGGAEKPEEGKQPRSGGMAREISAVADIQDEEDSTSSFALRLHGVHWPRQGRGRSRRCRSR